MHIRNRNAISAIRKKYERLEQFKKDKKNGVPFTQFNEAKALIIDMSLELEQIKREIYELHDLESGVNRYQRTVEAELAVLQNDPRATIEDYRHINRWMIRYKYPAVHIKHNGENIFIGNFEAHLFIRDITPYGSVNLTFTNDNWRQKPGSDRKYEHPHILDTGPCLGDFYYRLISFQRAGHVSEMLINIGEFLTSYNPDSIYISVDYWKDHYLDCGCLNNCECGAQDEIGLS